MRTALAWLAPATVAVPLALCVSCRRSGAAGAPDAAVDSAPRRTRCPSTGILAPPENPFCPSPGDLATWGPKVPVTAGTSDPPTPAGGTLTPGWYVLVAKTVYGSYLDEGNPFTDLAPEIEALRNGVTREAGYIDCSSMVTLYATSHASDTDLVNQTCRSLVPRALSLGEITYPGTATNAALPARAPGGLTSYTASGDAVTLVSLLPATDMNTLVVGSFTIVDRFVLASTFKPATAPASGAPLYDASPGLYAPGERDPRCPVDPPCAGGRARPGAGAPPVRILGAMRGAAAPRPPPACSLHLDGGGAFEFDVSTATNCPPNPPERPPDFALLGPLAGRCGRARAGCRRVRAPRSGVHLCRRHLRVPRVLVQRRVRLDVAGSSSMQARLPSVPRPLAGMPCSDEGLTCSYDEPCGPHLSFGSHHDLASSAIGRAWAASVSPVRGRLLLECAR